MKTTTWTRRVADLAAAAALPEAVITHLLSVSAQDLRERGGALLAASLGSGEGVEFLAAYRYSAEHPGVEDVEGLRPHEVWTRQHLPGGVLLLEKAAAEIEREIQAGPYQYLAQRSGASASVSGQRLTGETLPRSRSAGEHGG